MVVLFSLLFFVAYKSLFLLLCVVVIVLVLASRFAMFIVFLAAVAAVAPEAIRNMRSGSSCFQSCPLPEGHHGLRDGCRLKRFSVSFFALCGLLFRGFMFVWV